MTLIETLVAITILTVAIVAPMSLTVQSLSAAYYARDQVTAYHLAQEAIESVRAVRDANILKIAYSESDPSCNPMTLLCGIPVGQEFTIDTRNNNIQTCNGQCPYLQTDQNVYGYESGWADTGFRRTVRADFVPGTSENEITLTVTVTSRARSGQEVPVTIASNLHRWVADGSASDSPTNSYSQGSYASSGSQTFGTPGYSEFTVPLFDTLTVQCWGGGGGGGGDGEGQGTGGNGGNTSFGSLVAYGGRGGPYTEPGGAGGTASGGSINTTGEVGGTRTSAASGRGGNAPNGGTGGASITGVAAGNPGGIPGGGGSGGRGSTEPGSGGGAGGYVARTYFPGEDIVAGSVVGVTIGSGGVGDAASYSGGSGGRGECRVTWTGSGS